MLPAILTLLVAQVDVPLSDQRISEAAVVRFAGEAEAKEILAADDPFIAALSRFDLQCRLRTDQEVAVADYKAFVVQHVRPWQAEEAETVQRAIAGLQARLQKFRLPLPPIIRFVRTTGEEEAEAAYTRGDAIVLPTKVMRYPPTQLQRLLLHELFHVLSRRDGALRARLYGIIGFEVCEPIDLPPSLAPRKITNPDAPLVDCVITLAMPDGRTHTGAPVLYASRDYDAQRGGTIFQALNFRLLLVEKRSGRWQPLLKSGEPVVISVRDEAAYLDKIGKNTNYVIHPDEILADNFVRLVMEDRDVATPRILDAMRGVLLENK